MFKATRNDVQAQSWAALWGLSTGQTQLLGSNELGNATSCPNQEIVSIASITDGSWFQGKIVCGVQRCRLS